MEISNRLYGVVIAILALAPAACDTPESATSLHPEGPPEIDQVFMLEPDADGRIENVLAFGTHPDVPMERTRSVSKAAPLRQSLRIVFDELLLGNYLEEIQCNPRTGVTDCPQYSHIPEGTTPDDIASCAAPDTLDAKCNGPRAVCLNPDGVPCGIRDEENPTRPADGAADDLRLITGAVTLRCGNIEVGFDDATSFWQPSGNQLVPAGKAPENSLGPALILKPLGGLLPTNQADCHLVFAPNVVDKDHVQVCAPAGGDPAAACTPGNLDAFKFGSDTLHETSVQPQGGSTDVPLNSALRITLNTSIDKDSTPASVTVMEGNMVRADAMVRRLDPTTNPAAADSNRIEIVIPGGLRAGTQYTVTATPKDTFGVAAPAPITYSFTTTGS